MRLPAFGIASFICRAMLKVAALIVPSLERSEWLADWKSELWYLEHAHRSATSRTVPSRPSAMRFCLDAFGDAMWLRRNDPISIPRSSSYLRSPVSCTIVLAGLAVLTLVLFESLPNAPYRERTFLLSQLLIFGVSLLLVRISAPSPVADYLTPTNPLTGKRWLHWWGFFVIKAACVLTIVFCGTVDLGAIIAPHRMLPHATLVGYVLGFRWALMDQRRRCRVCLRLLTNPVRIGEASHTMLAWYGTELMCSKGHGLLHLPEMPGISYSRQQWLHLDQSWCGLFS